MESLCRFTLLAHSVLDIDISRMSESNNVTWHTYFREVLRAFPVTWPCLPCNLDGIATLHSSTQVCPLACVLCLSTTLLFFSISLGMGNKTLFKCDVCIPSLLAAEADWWWQASSSVSIAVYRASYKWRTYHQPLVVRASSWGSAGVCLCILA